MVISLSSKADQKHCYKSVPDEKVKFSLGGVGGAHIHVCCRGKELRRFWTRYRNFGPGIEIPLDTNIQ